MTLRVLVTGFGKFPGARDNPTALLVHALGGHRARLARLGVELETDVLPVNYAEVARKLEELDETLKPDAILHFGLAARRKFFSIETPGNARIRRELFFGDRLVGPPEQAALLKDRHRQSSVWTAAAPRVSKSNRPRARFQFSLSSAGRSSAFCTRQGRRLQV